MDLVFADPPYNLQLQGDLKRPDDSRVDAVDDDWDKFASFSAYDDFTRAWLAACRRVMKPSATLWVIGSYHNIFRVGTVLQDMGFWILNDIVWRKSNPMPNFRGRRFTNAHETLIWAARDAAKRDYTFNYEALKAGNDGIQMRSDWFIPLCTGEERLKGQRRQEAASDAKAGSPAGARDPRRVAARRSGARPVLRHRHDRRGGAPAAPALSSASSAKPNTPRRPKTASRAIEPMAEPALATFMTAREAPRVPFTALIERGIDLARHQTRRRQTAASGVGSRRRRACARRSGRLDPPHRALAQGLEACNGWTFWHVETPKGLTLIDDFRAIVRSEMAEAAE